MFTITLWFKCDFFGVDSKLYKSLLNTDFKFLLIQWAKNEHAIIAKSFTSPAKILFYFCIFLGDGDFILRKRQI